MSRQITTSDLATAASFAFVEHLMRQTTPETEETSSLQDMPTKLKNTVQKLLLIKRGNSACEAQRKLPQVVKLKDLSLDLQSRAKLVVFRLDKSHLVNEEVEPDSGDEWPCLFLMDGGEVMHVLYTPEMTYVDGYESFTEQELVPLIPATILRSIKETLYCRAVKRISWKASMNKKKTKKKKQTLAVPEVSSAPIEEVKRRQEDVQSHEVIFTSPVETLPDLAFTTRSVETLPVELQPDVILIAPLEVEAHLEESQAHLERSQGHLDESQGLLNTSHESEIKEKSFSEFLEEVSEQSSTELSGIDQRALTNTKHLNPSAWRCIATDLRQEKQTREECSENCLLS
jgi:hypothetical protein